MVDAPQSYIMLTGPYRNVGDSLIRRRALVWARDLGRPVVMMSGAPSADWDESLAIRPTDQIVRSRGGWLWQVCCAPAGSVLVIEPGEFNTDRRFYLSLAYIAIASAIIRIKGGRVVQMPRSLARRSKIGDLIYRATVRRGYLLWRERLTGEHFGRGQVVPDIGFDHEERVDGSGERNLLVISLRGDRPMPGEEWAQGVRGFAMQAGWRILAVAQVEEDNDRAAELADVLGGDVDLWDAATSSIDRERDVRALYADGRIVLSDRLHALIIGTVSGAVPIEIVPSPNGKARKHFLSIGLPNVSHDAQGLSREQVVELLKEAVAGAADVTERISAAAAELRKTRVGARRSAGSDGSL